MGGDAHGAAADPAARRGSSVAASIRARRARRALITQGRPGSGDPARPEAHVADRLRHPRSPASAEGVGDVTHGAVGCSPSCRPISRIGAAAPKAARAAAATSLRRAAPGATARCASRRASAAERRGSAPGAAAPRATVLSGPASAPPAAARAARPRSPADGWRSSGRLASARCTTASSAAAARPQCRRQRRLGRKMRPQLRLVAVAVERDRAGQHENAGRRPARTRRRERRRGRRGSAPAPRSRACRPSGRTRSGPPSASACLARPKSRQVDVAVLVEQHVRRLDVAMHVARAMDRVERVAERARRRGRPLRAQRPVAAHERAQVVSGHVAHDEIGLPVRDARAVDGQHVRVLDGGGGARLAQEARARALVVRRDRA